MKIRLLLAIFMLISTLSYSQDTKYNITSKVAKNISKTPIAGVSIFDVNGNTQLGITDEKANLI